jgi:hypothetical protein
LQAAWGEEERVGVSAWGKRIGVSAFGRVWLGGIAQEKIIFIHNAWRLRAGCFF